LEPGPPAIRVDTKFASASTGTSPPTEPDWPGDETEKEGALATAESSLRERIKLWADNPSERMEVRVSGVVQHRYNGVASARLPLFREDAHDTLATPTGLGTDRNEPHLKLLASGLDELLSVEFRDGSNRRRVRSARRLPRRAAARSDGVE